MKGAQLMIEDGFPEQLLIEPDQRREAWKGRKLTTPRPEPVARKDEDPTTKALRKELAKAEEAKKAERFARLKELKERTKKQAIKPAADAASQETTTMKKPAKTSKAAQVAALRTKRAAANGSKKATKKAVAKKAATAKARTPAAPKATAGAPKGVRPGSKLEIVVGLLTRKEGCTSAEVLAATAWPAVSMPQQAKAAGLTLRKEKEKGQPTRYFGSKAA
jgi:membrane protein involved in colicin uptake